MALLPGSVRIGSHRWSVDFGGPTHDVSIPVTPWLPAEKQIDAFGLGPATAAPAEFGDFKASVDAGASVNCPFFRICAHGNGTHTECVGHILPGCVTLADVGFKSILHPCVVVSIHPQQLNESKDEYAPGRATDHVISAHVLHDAVEEMKRDFPSVTEFLKHGVMLIRTLPNDDSKLHRKYTGTNPPYFTPAAMQFLLEHHVAHVAADVPSADREDDGGKMLAHKAFFGVSDIKAVTPEQYTSRTITELCYVPPSVKDGLYLIDLQVAPIHADAAPCRPVLYPVERIAM